MDNTEENKQRKAYNQHDQFALFMLQDPLWAEQFLRKALPPQLVDIIDWPTFQRLHDNDSNEDLDKTITDLAYKVYLKGKVVLYFLLVVEHRSSPPRKRLPIEFQLLQYMVAKLNRLLDQMKQDIEQPAEDEETDEAKDTYFPLPLLFVLYNGNREWKVVPLKEYYR